MHGATVLSGWDTMMLMIPFFTLLGAGMFRLDEHWADPKRTMKTRRPFCGIDSDGRAFFSDPDGRPSRTKESREIEGTFLSPGASSEG